MSNNLLGQMIKEKRKTKRLTLVQLSEASGIAISYLSKIENGKHNPSLSILKRIAEVIHLDVSAISAQVGGVVKDPRKIDIVKEVWTSEILIFNGEEIPITDEVAYRLEMAINMGVAWAKELLNKK